MRVRAPQIERQLVSVLRAWGMSDPHAETTAQAMVETDLRGVDSHGISMLPTYDQEFRQGGLNMRPLFKTVRRARCDRHGDLSDPWDHPGADVRGRACDGNQSPRLRRSRPAQSAAGLGRPTAVGRRRCRCGCVGRGTVVGRGT